MSFSVGIVGLPNVGKSTLFNAITKQEVAASNFPFTTIEPNVGVISVPDERIKKLAVLENSQKEVPTSIEFVDIAGLVKGAAAGAGLGNKFLSHIREVDAILQVVRFFGNDDIIHVDSSIDPNRDAYVVNTELMLADLSTVSKRMESLEKEVKSGNKEAIIFKSALEKIQKALDQGEMAATVSLNQEEIRLVRQLQLLTMKPMLYVGNMAEIEEPKTDLSPIVFLDAKTELELAGLPEVEKIEYMKELGISESGLDKLVRLAYNLLDLITFFTAGEKETKAWTIKDGTKAPQAAGVIHSDFEKGFIRAEIISCDKLLEAPGYAKAREKGWIRIEGKDYIMKDGDVAHFRVKT